MGNHVKSFQECLVVSFYDQNRMVAVCCFRNDATVEYFNETIPGRGLVKLFPISIPHCTKY